MSIDLENMLDAFVNLKVPENWARIAYPSLKPLVSWVKDFIERIEFY